MNRRLNNKNIVELSQLWLKAKKINISAAKNKKEIAIVFKAIIVSINELLKNDFNLKITNLGTFTVEHKKVKDPHTGKMSEDLKRVVKFKYKRINNLND